MPLSDMTVPELEAYRPDRREPADFDEFWATTLESARQHELGARFDLAESGLRAIDVYDVTFAGSGRRPGQGMARSTRRHPRAAAVRSGVPRLRRREGSGTRRAALRRGRIRPPVRRRSGPGQRLATRRHTRPGTGRRQSAAPRLHDPWRPCTRARTTTAA